MNMRSSFFGLAAVALSLSTAAMAGGPESQVQVKFEEHHKEAMVQQLTQQHQEYQKGHWTLDGIKHDMLTKLNQAKARFQSLVYRKNESCAKTPAQVETQTQVLETHFQQQAQAVQKYETKQEVLNAQESAITQLATSTNFMFKLSRDVCSFDGSCGDVFLFLFVLPWDVISSPFDFVASLVSGF